MSNIEIKPKSLSDQLRWTAAIIAVVAIAAAMYVLGDSRNSDHDATDRIMARLDAIEAARGQTGESAAHRNTPGMSAGGSTSGDIADQLLKQQNEIRTPEQMAAERDKQMRELEAQFARDVADPVSGGTTRDTLEKTITGEAMTATGIKPDGDVDIACKKNSCRIVSSFDKMGDAQDWSLFYITSAGGNVLSRTQMVFLPKPNGQTEVRIYANRSKG